MFQQLRSHSLSLQILLPILAFLPYILFIFTGDFPELKTHNAQGWIYHNWQLLLGERPWLLMIMGWALNILIAFSLYWLNIRFEIVGKRTVYIAFLFCLMVFTPLGFHSFHPGMLGGVFLLISLIFLFQVYHQKEKQGYLFNAGFFWGLACLLYPPLLAMIPMYFLGARFVRYNMGRDLILLIAGFSVPVWIWSGFTYLNGQFNYQWLSFLQWFDLRTTWPPEFPGNQLLWLLFILFIGLALALNINLFRVKKDIGRRVLTFMGQLIWLCPLIFLVFERVSIEILWLALVPISFLFSVAAFNSRRPFLTDLIFTFFFILMVFFQIKTIL